MSFNKLVESTQSKLEYLNEAEQAPQTAWDVFKQRAQGITGTTHMAVRGKLPNSWARFDSRNIYTLNPVGNPEEVIRNFLGSSPTPGSTKATATSVTPVTPSDPSATSAPVPVSSTTPVPTTPITASTEIQFNKTIKVLLEGTPISRDPKIRALNRASTAPVTAPVTAAQAAEQQPTQPMQPTGDTNTIPIVPEIDITKEPETFVQEHLKEITNIIISSRRRNDTLTIFDVADLHEKSLLNDDEVKQLAMRNFADEIRKKEPHDVEWTDQKIWQKYMVTKLHGNPDESSEYKKIYDDQISNAQRQILRNNRLQGKSEKSNQLPPDVLQKVHYELQKQFQSKGLYYLAPQQYEQFKAGSVGATKDINIGRGIKKALDWMQSTSPTVKGR